MPGQDPRERYHDRLASRYEELYDRPYWRLYREISWRHLRRFLPARRPAWALDLGCGPGWFGQRLLKAGFHVTFLDISAGMLDQARERLAGSSRPEQTEFLKADMEDLSALPSGRFAFATAQGDPLGFTQRPARALKELYRVLEPGARAVLSVDHRPPAARAFLERGDLAGLESFLKGGRSEWLARRGEERFPVWMFDVDAFAGLLERQGFAVLDRIGKTVLFQREDEALLASTPMGRLVALEEKLNGRPGWLGRATHLQVAVEKA